MAVHIVVPDERTVRGVFSRELEPILTIDPGDTVRFATLEAGWWLGPHTFSDNPPRPRLTPAVEEYGAGHALCGPVAVRGAEPGMTLEVRIDEIVPGAWGTTYTGGRPTPTNIRLGLTEQKTILAWTLDAANKVWRDSQGHTVALRPFMGVMGMPADEPGIQSTTPPRNCGGNIDCKELTAGSTLYLPVAVPGALFSVGDGHGAQSDGEVGGTAIECPMERVSLTFNLRDNPRLTTPRADTPAGLITFGFHEDLTEAAMIALDDMVNWMGEMHGLSRVDALALASLLVDLRVTQIVNRVRGVHAVLAHDALAAS